MSMAMLQDEGLATMQAFDLKRNAPLPAALLPFMRLGYASTAEEVAQVRQEPALLHCLCGAAT